MIEVISTKPSEDFFSSLTNQESKKMKGRIGMLSQEGFLLGPPYAKPLKGTNGLRELIVNNYNNKFFRLFYFFKGDIAYTLNGFIKETGDTPDIEIQRAMELREQLSKELDDER